MATLQVQYDARNAAIKRLVHLLIESGVFMPLPKRRKMRKSRIDEADEDIRMGRIYTANSVEEMFEQLEKESDEV